MAIVIDPDGVYFTGDFRREVVLSPEEQAAFAAVSEALGSLSESVHCERRSDSYLSIVCNENGDDFCRVKASPRTTWISLDAWCCDFGDDPRMADVSNKKQRHWKIKLTSVSDISTYADLIYRTASAALSRHEAT